MQDAKALAKRCEACQRFASKPHAPAIELKTIPLAWPFTQWGHDMVGLLKKSSPGGHTFLLVVVDKFTKWIEATPVTSAATTCAVNFMRPVICRFGVPYRIITDNGSNFTTTEFQDYCEDLGIQLKYASVAHPQTNGQVEKANGLITSGIKKRLMMSLKRATGSWPEELPLSPMEPMHHSQQLHAVPAILHCPWCGGLSAIRGSL
jgi:transposase InsO family protein